MINLIKYIKCLLKQMLITYQIKSIKSQNAMISHTHKYLKNSKQNHSTTQIINTSHFSPTSYNSNQNHKKNINPYVPKRFHKYKNKPLQIECSAIISKQISAQQCLIDQYPQTTRNYYEELSSACLDRPKLQLNNQDLPIKTPLRETNSTQCQSPKIRKSYANQKIRQYKIIKFLGKGKYGQVYLSKHEISGFLGALKIIKKTSLSDQSGNKSNKILNQLINEIKIQSCLNHPNLIKIYDFFSDTDFVYLFLELASDGQLFELLQRRDAFSEEATSLMAREIAQGIRYMHSKSIIHRDIKLENVVLTHGMAKICDFGCAVYQPREFRKTLCGTPLYLSPQVLQGRRYNQKIDIWALGTLVYEMFTNQNPFKIGKEQQLSKIITTDLEMSVGCPQIRSFVKFVLKKNPCKRPDAAIIFEHPFIVKYEDVETSDQVCRTD